MTFVWDKLRRLHCMWTADHLPHIYNHRPFPGAIRERRFCPGC